MTTPQTSTQILKSRQNTREIKTNSRQATQLNKTFVNQTTPNRESKIPVKSRETVHGPVNEDKYKNSDSNKTSNARRDKIEDINKKYKSQKDNEQNSNRRPVSNKTSKHNESFSRGDKTSTIRNRTPREQSKREINDHRPGAVTQETKVEPKQGTQVKLNTSGRRKVTSNSPSVDPKSHFITNKEITLTKTKDELDDSQKVSSARLPNGYTTDADNPSGPYRQPKSPYRDKNTDLQLNNNSDNQRSHESEKTNVTQSVKPTLDVRPLTPEAAQTDRAHVQTHRIQTGADTISNINETYATKTKTPTQEKIIERKRSNEEIRDQHSPVRELNSYSKPSYKSNATEEPLSGQSSGNNEPKLYPTSDTNKQIMDKSGENSHDKLKATQRFPENTSERQNILRQTNSRQPDKGIITDVRKKQNIKEDTSGQKIENTRNNTENIRNSSPKVEAKPKSSRQNTLVKQSRSRQNTEVKTTNKTLVEPQSISHKVGDGKLTSPFAENNLKQDKRHQNLSRDTNEEESFERHVSPYKTSFSRPRTRVESVLSKSDGERTPHMTPIIPPIPLIPLTSSAGFTDPDINVSVSLPEPKQLVLGDFSCQHCDMTFQSATLLQYHTSRFCIAKPMVQDIYALSQAREFFTLGNSSTIHSTPRGWSVTGKTPMPFSRTYTFGDNHAKLSKLHWDKCFNGKVPEFAVKAGFDQSAGCSIYVCRAKVDRELVPGKVVPARECAYVSAGGQEHLRTDYEVLTDPHELLSWKSTDVPGGIPRGAQKGGYDANDLTYFVARASAPDGSMCCGKYVPQQMKCYYSWYGQEHSAVKFEFLCKK